MSKRVISSYSLRECTEILNQCILPKCDEGNERPLDSSDFEEIKLTFECSSDKILKVLSSDLEKCIEVKSSNSSSEVNDFLTYFLIYRGENSKESLWTSSVTLLNCQHIQDVLFGSDQVCLTLLTEAHGKIFKRILSELRPCLLSNTWKLYPTAVNSYVWCLTLLKKPYISEYLDLLLPTSLIITDDFTVSNKIIGVECLHHIVSNSTLTELQSRSHDEVIYKALEMCLHEKDVKLVSVLIPCILTLLNKMYFLCCNHYGEWTHYDDVLTKFIYHLKMEPNNNYKKSLLEFLPQIISSCRLISVRYLESIVDIFEDSCISGITVLPALKVVSEILTVYSPSKHHLNRISFILLKIIYSCGTYNNIASESIIKACKEVTLSVDGIDASILQTLSSSSSFDALDAKLCMYSLFVSWMEAQSEDDEIAWTKALKYLMNIGLQTNKL